MQPNDFEREMALPSHSTRERDSDVDVSVVDSGGCADAEGIMPTTTSLTNSTSNCNENNFQVVTRSDHEDPLQTHNPYSQICNDHDHDHDHLHSHRRSSAVVRRQHYEHRPQHNDQRRVQWKRWFLLIILLATIAFVVIDYTAYGNEGIIKRLLVSVLNWVEHNPVRGGMLVCVVYILATILFVPGSILTLGAGYALGSAIPGPTGLLVATLAVFVGASIGSIFSFLLGRYLFRDCVMNLASNYPIFHAVDGALQRNGLKIMILLRLSPLIPYNALDYMSGITAITLRDYTLALVALLPGSFMLSFVGASASSLADSTSTENGASRTVKIITIISGLVFGGTGIFAVSYYSKRELDRVSRKRRPS
jgi:uncharacterized membrane protein YdjX (TVP38/TMEM64 family)